MLRAAERSAAVSLEVVEWEGRFSWLHVSSGLGGLRWYDSEAEAREAGAAALPRDGGAGGYPSNVSCVAGFRVLAQERPEYGDTGRLLIRVCDGYDYKYNTLWVDAGDLLALASSGGGL